jgi:hypothetical protein
MGCAVMSASSPPGRTSAATDEGNSRRFPGWDVAARAGTNRAAGFAIPVIARSVHVDRRTRQSAAAEDDCPNGGMTARSHGRCGAPRPGVHARCLGRRAELIRAGVTDYGGLWLAVTPSGEAIERFWAVLTEPGHIGVWFGQGTPAEVGLRPGGIMVLDHGEYGMFPTASRRSTRRATSPTAEPAPTRREADRRELHSGRVHP